MTDLSKLPEVASLTAKQRAFILDYITSNNAAESARKAGYAKSCANTLASQTLARPSVKRALEAIYRALDLASGVTAEWVISKLKDIAEDEKANNSDKIRCLELLGRTNGMFKDQNTNNTVIFSDAIGKQLVDRLSSPKVEDITIYSEKDTDSTENCEDKDKGQGQDIEAVAQGQE